MIKLMNYIKIKKKSKYSKRNKKKETKKFKKDMIPIHNRATTQFLINLNYPQNKNAKSNNNQNSNNISKSNKDLSNPLPKLMNFKIYDAFIMSSNYKNNLTERDKEIIIRNSLKNNKSIRKIDVSISHKVISKNLYNYFLVLYASCLNFLILLYVIC